MTWSDQCAIIQEVKWRTDASEGIDLFDVSRYDNGLALNEVSVQMKSKSTDNSVEYTHGPLDESVVAIGGSFRITEEKRLAYDGKEVLYLVGLAHMDNACCGAWGCCYAIVKGVVEDWKCKEDQQGYAITRVVPIADQNERDQIRKKIMSDEMVQQVVFT